MVDRLREQAAEWLEQAERETPATRAVASALEGLAAGASIVVAHQLEPHQVRLLEALGVTWRVDPANASDCARTGGGYPPHRGEGMSKDISWSNEEDRLFKEAEGETEYMAGQAQTLANILILCARAINACQRALHEDSERE